MTERTLWPKKGIEISSLMSPCIFCISSIFRVISTLLVYSLELCMELLCGLENLYHMYISSCIFFAKRTSSLKASTLHIPLPNASLRFDSGCPVTPTQLHEDRMKHWRHQGAKQPPKNSNCTKSFDVCSISLSGVCFNLKTPLYFRLGFTLAPSAQHAQQDQHQGKILSAIITTLRTQGKLDAMEYSLSPDSRLFSC